MASWSNGTTAIVNLITLIFGLFLVSLGGYLTTHQNHSTCFSLLNVPCFRIGGLLVVTSLLGVLGSCFRSSFLLWLYLLLYVILIIFVTMGVVLWIVVMIEGAVRLDVGRPHKLNDFTVWFQDQVMGIADWSQVRKCLIDRNICFSRSQSKSIFWSENVKDGCCHRPRVCIQSFLKVHDCDVWENKANKMCYYCSSCVAGFVTELAAVWQKLFPGIVALLIALIVMFALGCRAFKQNKTDHYSKLNQTSKP